MPREPASMEGRNWTDEALEVVIGMIRDRFRIHHEIMLDLRRDLHRQVSDLRAEIQTELRDVRSRQKL
jgi:hypothetical protein